MLDKAINEFLRLESASGILLLVAAVLAMAIVNSPLDFIYHSLLRVPIEVRVGDIHLAKPLLLWVNDGLMAIFFLLVGLEIKRELLDGELSDPARIVLPVAAAAGGMAIPAAIYAALNAHDPLALHGWAIPSATDIAFALGVLALFGKAVPSGLKLFLLTLAIIDDLGAIIIIAVFYSGDLSAAAFGIAALLIAVLAWLNRRRVVTITPYVITGTLLWVAVLKSGVHATLAGVVLAMFIPLRASEAGHEPPLRRLEHDLHPAVAYAILPLFAFANAGVSLSGLGMDVFLSGVPLGIALGLMLGKPAGVMGCAWVVVRTRLAALPDGVTWMQMWGASLLCGIGFTMSLFIGSLAFEHGGPDYSTEVRLGILVGSLVCGISGYVLLRQALRVRP